MMKKNVGPWALYAFAIIFLASIAASVGGMTLVYWGCSFHTPGLNEASIRR